MGLHKLRIAFYTLGCKVNLYETEVMMKDARENGAEIVDFSETADVYVVNTCSVTNIADRKSRQILHRAKKQNPDSVVVACGCYAESESEEALHKTGVDLILGNEEKKRFPEALERFLGGNREKIAVVTSDQKTYVKEPVVPDFVRTRADLKVQDGCNQFCSYCIIPYVRGRVRSKSIEDCVSEARAITKSGVREIVLSGIHLSSYGTDLPERDGKRDSLIDLIRAIHEIEEVKRIRMSSLEPRIVTEAFAREASALPKLCPHFHLALQSGCEKTLRAMNRRYTPEEFMKSVELLRKYFDDPAITTDLIVGFPGETEDDFRESLEFVRAVGFYELHVFPFSVRKGTKAAGMEPKIDPETKKNRVREAIALGEELRERYLSAHFGKTAEVLTEEAFDETYRRGYTREYIEVLVKDAAQNAIVRGTLGPGKNGLPILENGVLVSR